MDEKICFSVLEIEKTKDKRAIQDAYRRLLVQTNPEDDPEGFKRLREAYEAANAYAGREEALERKPETPLELWLERVKKVYFSLSKRLNEECWKELLQEELCCGLDTSVETRDALLGFLAEHYRIQTSTWRLLDETFCLREVREELLERFPAGFVDFVVHQCENEGDFPYELLEGEDDADYDGFLYYYYELSRQNDRGDLEGAKKSLEALAHIPVSHPYFRLEKARYDRLTGEGEKAALEIHRLLELLSEDMRLLIYGGEILWENQEKDEAAKCFRRVLKEWKDHYTANKYMALYCREKGDYREAKEHCVEALRLGSQEAAVHECMQAVNLELIRQYKEQMAEGTLSEADFMELGWCCLQNDMAGEAIELLEGRPISQGGKMAEYRNLLSKCYFVEQRYEEAIREARICLSCIAREAKVRGESEEGEDPEKERIPGRIAGSWEIIAQAFHMLAKEEELSEEERASRYREALEAMERALEQKPGNRNYQLDKIQILMDQGLYEKATDVCDELIKADGEDFYAYILRQKCCYERYDGQGVVDDFYSAKEIFAGYPEMYELAADVFIKHGQYEDAKGILSQAKEAGVSSPKLDVQRITILRETAESEEDYKGVYEEAVRLLDSFRENKEQVEDKDFAELCHELARCCRGVDRIKEALKYIEMACGKDPQKLYRWVRANILADLKEFDRALEDYLVCVREYGDNEIVYENTARCCQSLGDRTEAVKYYRKALEVNPENPRVNSKLAGIFTDILMETGDRQYYEEALPFAARQLEIEPSAYYYIERGILHMEAGAWEEADADFQEAARLEPDNAYAYNNWGCIYKYKGEYERALELFKKSIEVMEEGDTLLPYGNIGSCYERMCDYQKAAEWYRKGNMLFPKNQSIRRDLIRIYKKMNLLEKALCMICELYKGSDEVRYYVEAAEVYVQMKRYKKAKSFYDTALKKDPKRAEAWLGKGEIFLYYRKAPQTALYCFRKALENTKKWEGNYDRSCLRIMECYWELGTPEKGREYQRLAYEAWIESAGSIEKYLNNYFYRRSRLYYMGAMYYYLGDTEKAGEYFEQIAGAHKCRHCNNMECEDYWEAMGLLREREGRIEEAVCCYGKACKESKGNNLSISKVERLAKKRHDNRH